MKVNSYNFSFGFIGLLVYLITSCGAEKSPQVYETVDASLLTTAQGITYHNGKLFTGKAFVLNEKQDTVLLDIFSEGKLNGVSRAWYAKGIIMHVRPYKNGHKQGFHQIWWPNGKLKAQYNFKDDEYNGSVKEWYESGPIFRHFTYNMGHEEGPQKMWRVDGSIYANYVLKNNRIYGLSGRKNCKNVWKG